MNLGLFGPLLVVVFVALLLVGRSEVAKGANQRVAYGATLLTLAAVAGSCALLALASLAA